MDTKNLYSDKDLEIEKIADSLKEKGLIQENRNIEAVEGFKPSLRLQLTKNNSILYDRYLREKWDLKEDHENTIRFILLHEEAHLTEHKFQNYSIFLSSTFAIFLFFSLMGIFMHLPELLVEIAFNSCCFAGFLSIGVIFLLFITLKLSVVLSLKLLQPWNKKNEINCDLYAAKVLREHFDVKKPSKAAYRILKPRDYTPPSIPKQIKTLFFSLKIPHSLLRIVDPHPHWKKRLKAIQSEVDEQ